MRIVVTKNGKILVNELDEGSSFSNQTRFNNSSSFTRLPNIQNKNDKSHYIKKIVKYKENINNKRSSSLINRKTLDDYFNRDDTKVDMRELNMAKEFKVSKPKLNISQVFLDKYDDLDAAFKHKLDDLSNTLKSSWEKKLEKKQIENLEENKNANLNIPSNIKNSLKSNMNTINKDNSNNIMNNSDTGFNFSPTYGGINNNFNNSGFTTTSQGHRKIYLGDIISRNNLIKLRKKISINNKGSPDKRMPLDEQNMKSFNFRSKYENKQASFEYLNMILNMPINSDKSSLIQYFQQKKKISPQYFENLLRYDESQMYKLNKICRMIFEQKNAEKKENLKSKSTEKDFIVGKQDSGKVLDGLNKMIEKSIGIINDYKNLERTNYFRRKNEYKNEVRIIKENYWDKYKIDNLMTNKEKIYLDYIKEQKIKKAKSRQSKMLLSDSAPNLFFSYKKNAQ